MYIYMYNSLKACLLINPRCMRRRVMVVVLCVLSVTMLATTYLVYVENTVSSGSL